MEYLLYTYLLGCFFVLISLCIHAYKGRLGDFMDNPATFFIAAPLLISFSWIGLMFIANAED